MRSALDILSAVPWCIDPKWLRFMAALANRDGLNARELAAELRRGPDDGWGSFDHNGLRPGALNAKPGSRLDGTFDVRLRDGVAIVSLIGPIFPRANLFTVLSGATSMDLVAQDLRVVADSGEVSAVALDVDSPGGAAAALDELALQIESIRARKPIIAHACGLCTSAAYWLAAAAGEIVANRTAILGSVGVVVSVAVQEQPDQDGQVDYEIVSSNAPNKRLDPRESEDRAKIVALLDQLETTFIDEVARLRGLTRAQVIGDFGRGGLEAGQAAVAAGMADRVGTFEDVMAELVRRRNGARP